jgi:hypothetical protein
MRIDLLRPGALVSQKFAKFVKRFSLSPVAEHRQGKGGAEGREQQILFLIFFGLCGLQEIEGKIVGFQSAGEVSSGK